MTQMEADKNVFLRFNPRPSASSAVVSDSLSGRVVSPGSSPSRIDGTRPAVNPEAASNATVAHCRAGSKSNSPARWEPRPPSPPVVSTCDCVRDLLGGGGSFSLIIGIDSPTLTVRFNRKREPLPDRGSGTGTVNRRAAPAQDLQPGNDTVSEVRQTGRFIS